MLIAVINQSTRVNDAEVLRMTAAVAKQVRMDVAPLWDRAPASVISYGAVTTKKQLAATVPAKAHGITIVDAIPDEPDGVLGFHTEDEGGKVWGVVAADPSLDNGATVLHGDWSVSSILSHEVIEMYIDPNCNLWAGDGAGKNYCVEVCDPVEAPAYDVDGVSVSNFVTPAWFDPNANMNGRTLFDKLQTVRRPFTKLEAGYYIYETAGEEHFVGGDGIPAWRMQSKSKHFSRTHRRMLSTGELLAV